MEGTVIISPGTLCLSFLIWKAGYWVVDNIWVLCLSFSGYLFHEWLWTSHFISLSLLLCKMGNVLAFLYRKVCSGNWKVLNKWIILALLILYKCYKWQKIFPHPLYQGDGKRITWSDMHSGALEGKLSLSTRDSCIVIINIVSPNGLGWKPKGVAAAETQSSPPLWLMSDVCSRQHPSFPPFQAGFAPSLGTCPNHPSPTSLPG